MIDGAHTLPPVPTEPVPPLPPSPNFEVKVTEAAVRETATSPPAPVESVPTLPHPDTISELVEGVTLNSAETFSAIKAKAFIGVESVDVEKEMVLLPRAQRPHAGLHCRRWHHGVLPAVPLG